ncbi:Endopolyphosphatase [Collariella sp. IMI 366227]|nr:Endopolyphosphatase [Collariella sp. IMI 366227]
MAGSCISQTLTIAPRTDIHPDEYYKPHTSTDEDGACHRGKGPAGPYGAETSDCDSPFSLVNATFDWIAANLKDDIDFVVWTGDSARHDRDEGLPRNADQVLGTNRWIADKFASLFADPNSSTGMAIPVVPNFGNNDILPHNILLPGPNKWFQTYSHIWRHFIPEAQRHSFEFGGWFHVEVIPNRLAVFSLNTLYFFDRNAGVDGCANPSEPGYKQLEWLRVQLQFLRERGMKAILMGHVPPARTESKKLWDETCWQKYSLWMHQFRDVVVVGMYGHMNIDHFLIHDKNDIDIAGLSGLAERKVETHEAMEDELSVQSASEYLMELRDKWAKLTPPPAFTNGVEDQSKSKKRKKGKKGKKAKDPWGERYHLSLVGPSVVPTYFPTLRVLEYNITGLEDAILWRDTQAAPKTPSQKHFELRHEPASDLTPTTQQTTTNKKENKKPHPRHGDKNPPPEPDRPEPKEFGFEGVDISRAFQLNTGPVHSPVARERSTVFPARDQALRHRLEGRSRVELMTAEIQVSGRMGEDLRVTCLLTIDDAPSDRTRDILSLLKTAGAHATFFVIGSQVKGRENVLVDILRGGHELANHGMRDEPARKLPTAELEAQIVEVQGMIDAAYRAVGREPPEDPKRRYYRPGSGFFNSRIRGLARKLGYRIVLGSIYPHDAQISWPRVNARHVLSLLSPGGIIVVHDRRSWTEPMLKRVLPEMKRRGYEAVTLSRMLEEVTG